MSDTYHQKLRAEGFLQGRIYYDGRRYYEWSATKRGWDAAYDAVNKLPQRNPLGAPLQLEFRYTVEEFCYRTDQTYECGDRTEPCGLHYRVGIRQWSRLVKQEPAAA